MKLPRFTESALAVILALIFAVSGAAKIADVDSFWHSLEQGRILPESLAKAVTFLVPSLEILLAIALLMPERRLSAAYLAVPLCGAFLLYSAFTYKLTMGTGCACFGKVPMPFDENPLFRTTIILFISIGITLLTRRRINSS